MNNRWYNNLILFISFLATIGFAVIKILGLITASWWFIAVPTLISWLFLRDEDD